jgi:hypothetical protein
MSDGTILELVSRGKKDAYQIQNPVRTWFGSPYEKRSPTTREIRRFYPENPPRFGQSFDIVLPSDGDVLMSFELRIKLPTWLPPTIAAKNLQPNAFDIKVLSDPYVIQTYQTTPPSSTVPITPFIAPPVYTHYGWCDGAANYLIDRWALFVDNIMVLDGYGEFNNWFPDMETTQLHAPLIHASTGRVQNNIQVNATLPELVFRVPIPGCQGKSDTGLPLCAFKNQKVFLRFWLLGKDKMVQSDELPHVDASGAPIRIIAGQEFLPLYEFSPAPWGGRNIIVNNVLQSEKTLSVRELGHPYIYAQCAVLNVDNELRKSMAAQAYEIRFQQHMRDDWTVENAAFVPGANYRRLLTINGIFQSLFLGFRSVARTQQNRYSDLLPSYGDWLTNISLNVNGLDRILNWPPKKLRTLSNNTQLMRDVNIALYYLIFGISPENEPGGTCNLSRCQKAVTNLIFENVPLDPMTNSNVTYAFIVGLSWNVLDIKDGIATLRYPR